MISSFHAAILGIVEGLTEFLPVSSTGHLILTSHWLGLGYGEGVKAFEVVIQLGALLAVVGLYFPSIKSMLRGLGGKDPAGLKLFMELIVAFLPAAVVGLLAESKIKALLFGPWPVVMALSLGGVAMIVIESAQRRWNQEGGVRTLSEMTLGMAFIIGCAQCLAMWPGTSRSMVTILAALLLGFTARDAAKFSFLLALPTLSAATVYDLHKDGRAILEAARFSGLAIGFIVSFIVAWIAVKGFIAYLTRHGMSVFGWYRIVAALIFAVALLSQVTLVGTVVDGTKNPAPSKPAGLYLDTTAGADQIYANPIKDELEKLAGHRVKVSGSIHALPGSNTPTIKVLSYVDLDKKKK